jgi:hypothetical protein
MCGTHKRYTRYADDMLISSPEKFNYKEWEESIQNVLRPNFEIKHEKTRFGSSSGQNWNLGLMLNKDNQITLGHAKKERMKAVLHNFIIDTPRIRADAETLQGQLSYFNSIEPDYTQRLIAHTDTKYNVNIKQILHDLLA